MNIEKIVSLGLLYTEYDNLISAEEKKLALFKKSYLFTKEKNPKYHLPETFEECSIDQLDKIKKSTRFKELHSIQDSIISLITESNGVEMKNGYPWFIKEVKKQILKRINSVKAGELLLIEKVTPEWAENKTTLFIEVKTPVVTKKKYIPIITPKESEKEYKKGISYFQIDAKFLPFRLDSDKKIIKGWPGDFEGIQFPSGTNLSEQFPTEFIKPPSFSQEIQYRISILSKGRLIKMKDLLRQTASR